MKSNIKLILASAAISFVAISAAKADYCENTVNNAVFQQVDQQFNAQTAEIRDVMAFLEATGKTGTPLYTQLSQGLGNARQQFNAVGQQTANNGIHDCRAQIAPIQSIVDLSVANLTGGLSLILPPNMTHIDMGEVMSGNILGGNNSFFRKNLGIKW